MAKFIVKKHKPSLKEGKNKRDLLLLSTTEGSEFFHWSYDHTTHTVIDQTAIMESNTLLHWLKKGQMFLWRVVTVV